jgi:hypothetical protein
MGTIICCRCRNTVCFLDITGNLYLSDMGEGGKCGIVLILLLKDVFERKK